MAGGIVEDHAVEDDPPRREGPEAGQGAQEGGLAGAVRPDHRGRAARGDREAGVEDEPAEGDADPGVEGSSGGEPAVAQPDQNHEGDTQEHE